MMKKLTRDYLVLILVLAINMVIDVANGAT